MSDAIVVIPAYNERENIEKIVQKVFDLPRIFDILIVDDNSPDGTANIVRSIQSEYPNLHLLQRPRKQGLGPAYLDAFQWGLKRDYEFIIQMDADFSHNPNDLLRLDNTCKEGGFDVVIGSRYIKGVNVVNWPISRVLLSYVASRYVRIILGIPIEDSTAGFICYRRKVLETVEFNKVKFMGYAFQIEMKYMAWKLGFKIKEIPVVFTNRVAGKSKMSKSIIREAACGVLQLKLRNLPKRH